MFNQLRMNLFRDLLTLLLIIVSPWRPLDKGRIYNYLWHELHYTSRKCKLWNKYQRTKSTSDYCEYFQSRNKLCSLTRSLLRNYETNLASNRSSNVKQFWKYVNSRLKTRPSINSLRRDDNSVVDSDQDKCHTGVCLTISSPVYSLRRIAHLFPSTNLTAVIQY